MRGVLEAFRRGLARAKADQERIAHSPGRRRDAALRGAVVLEVALFLFLYYAFGWELLAAGKASFLGAIVTYLYGYGFTYAPASCRCVVERQWRVAGRVR